MDALDPTRDQPRAEIFACREVSDNLLRRHSSPGYVSPDEYERAHHPDHR